MNSTLVPSAPPKKHRNLAQGVVAFISDDMSAAHQSGNRGGRLGSEAHLRQLRLMREHEDSFNAIARQDPEAARAAL